MVYRNDELEVAVSQEVLLRPEDFGSQDVSNLAWACAKLLWRRKHFLQGLEMICMKKAAELQVQACASAVWAFAKMELLSQQFLHTVVA